MNSDRNFLKFDFTAPQLAPSVTSQSPPPRLFLNVTEAADLLGFTPGAMRKQVSRRAFPSGVLLRLGSRTLRFDPEKLIAWARSRPVHAESASYR